MLRTALLLLLGLGSASVGAQTWDVPLDTLEARVARQPDDASARRALADRLVGEGTLEAAIPHLRWLVEEAPEDPARHLLLAQVLSWTERQPEAIAAYESLLGVAPEHEEGRIALASLLIWNGGAARAAQLLAPIADREPDAAEIQKLYAFALHGAKRAREARSQYDRALKLTPHDPVLLAESGILERWEGDWSVGRSRMSRALQLGVEAEVAERVRAELNGLARAIAPRAMVSVEHAEDSNGLTRTRFPSHTLVQFSPAWSAGVTIVQERLSQTLPLTDLPSIDAAATFIYPYVSYSPIGPLAFRAYAGLQDVHSEGSGMSGAIEAEWKQASPRFQRSILRVQSDASVDGVRALGEGIRSTALISETYAEPLPDWGLGLGATGLWYSDGNTRLNLSASTRVMVLKGRPLELGVTGGGGYEHSAIPYVNSDPYWTPRNLLTVLGGGVVVLKPATGLTLEPEVYAAHQRDATARASSVGYRLRVTMDRGRHSAGFLFEEWGSSVYSVRRVGLRYEIALW